MPNWFVLSSVAAVLWGVQYALTGHLLTGMTPAGLMFVTSLAGTLVYGAMVVAGGNYGQLVGLGTPAYLPVMAGVVVSGLVANYCISAGIQSKNATLASMVEISYPVFTALFAFLVFRDNHLNWTSAAGAALVLAGTMTILVGGR